MCGVCPDLQTKFRFIKNYNTKIPEDFLVEK
jgi:hypothetical protein